MNKDSSYSDLDRIDAMTDADIDYSDIPEFDDNFFKNAKIVTPPKKEPLSLRIDSDVVQFFKSHGKGYQAFMNAVLRAYYEAHRK